ncbi:MAG: hypothetical protein AAF546_08420 [Verrucomicrobiota bacterium]
MKQSELPPRPPLYLFFDENCSPLLAAELQDFFRSDYEQESSKLVITHIQSSLEKGLKDTDWTKMLSKDPWIIFTEEKSKAKEQNALVVVCKELGLTHVLIKNTLSKRADQKEGICQAWKFIRILPYLPKGTEVRLTNHHAKGGLAIASIHIGNQRLDNWCQKEGINIPSMN